MPIQIHSKQKISGASLIEILITILIMGVGALGVASMQLTGLKYNSGSHSRTQASLLANDMMDRLRANREVAQDKTIYDTNGFIHNVSATPPKNCYENTCTPDEMAAHDKFAWLERVAALLAFGQGSISHSEINGGTERIYQISLQWRQRSNAKNGDDLKEIKNFTFRGGL